MGGDFTRGKATHNDLAEKYNPFYVFCWAMPNMLVLLATIIIDLFLFQRSVSLTNEESSKKVYTEK